jgi:hypothetical protein
MILRVAIFLFLVGSLASMNSAQTFAQSKSEVSTEEYAVYDAAIAKIFAQRAVNQLRIISPTVDIAEIFMDLRPFGVSNEAEDIKFWKARFQNIKRLTMEDYLANSKRKSDLKRSFKHGFDYVIWEVPAALKSGETPKTEKQWLDNECFVQLSRVGFDREHEQALLYLTYLHSGRRGEGVFVFLAKADNQWTVAKVERVWVS